MDFEQLTLWRVPTLFERALGVLAAQRQEIHDLTKRGGPRETASGPKRSIDRLERIRRMDEKLASEKPKRGRGRPSGAAEKNAEFRLRLVAMWALAERSTHELDQMMDWPKGTGAKAKHEFPEIFKKHLNGLLDRAFDVFQRDRVRLVSRLMNECSTALEIVSCSMRGEVWNEKTVTLQQYKAAEVMLKRFQEYTAKDPNWVADREDSDGEEDPLEALVEGYTEEAGLEKPAGKTKGVN